MSIEVKKGNFEFITEIYPDFYDRIVEAEREAFLDYATAGNNLRKVYESWLKCLMVEYGYETQAEKVRSLNDRRIYLMNHGKLPKIDKYEYISVLGKKKKLNGYLVWQKFGNQCAHVEQTLDDPDVTYSNLEKVFRIVHKILREEYKRIKGHDAAQKIAPFDQYIIPIKDNYVISSNVPFDKPVSNCIREYETCSFNENGRVDKYGIVRVFKKKDMDEKLLQLRDREAFSEAAMEAGIQFDGNVQVDVLSKMDSIKSEFYIVIYKFFQKPIRLNNAFLRTLTLEEREGLCHKICKIIYNFHSLSAPIYHRNISFDCVYVVKNKKNEYEPSVIKLDCAKISSEEFGTVIANVKNTHERLQQKMFLKYTAPEVRIMLMTNSIEVSWDKADIYSLGVLCGDILNGEIEPNEVPAFKLQRSGVKVQIVQMIVKMRNRVAQLRPDVKTIVQSFEEMD